jgi:hypothetical protein
MLSSAYRPVTDRNVDSRPDMSHHSGKRMRFMRRQGSSSWLLGVLFEESILPAQAPSGARRRPRILTWRFPS